MPVYEYSCTSCGKAFEYEHRMSERRTVCEACGGELERLISRTSFAFKGGGWYKDLYASAKPAAADAAPKAATDTAAAKPSGGDGGSGGDSGSSSGGTGGSGAAGSGSSSGGTSGSSATAAAS